MGDGHSRNNVLCFKLSYLQLLLNLNTIIKQFLKKHFSE